MGGKGPARIGWANGERDCTRCGLWKPLDQFRTQKRDGEDEVRYRSICRPCERAGARLDPEVKAARAEARKAVRIDLSGSLPCLHPDVARRFWSKVDTSGKHWLWTGTPNSKGYAQMSIAGDRPGVHRVSYWLNVGPIPPGYEVDHLCRVPLCVRPDHLEATPKSINGERRHLDAEEHANITPQRWTIWL